MADLGWPASYDDDGNPVDMPADPLPDEPSTDLGYARRLVHVYGGRLRYVPAWRRWLIWDGRRWAHDSTVQAARWMKAIARRLTADALAIEDPLKRSAALSAARRGESSRAIAGALTLASTEAELVVSPDQLDADPFLLNCANGTLDLRTGELRGHDPADLLTKMTGAAYDPEASGPEFAKFLAARSAARTRCGTTSAGCSVTAWRAAWPSMSCGSSTAPGSNGKGTLHRCGGVGPGRLRRRRRPGTADRPDLRRAPDQHR